ncbi:response regulator transcription factor [Leucobacter sp. OH1287]|uniref:response regulator transcription factor n=1 Tax=Leucobacter sp. OH1287 TaxID=2491049 RepID=UPI000F5E83A8|nr:response regulator transcription factor [Leucobacter sp. OH1287]RRD61168.1 DNA-binding response regulator [Leucobacter sp. OH1287]
MIRMVIVDDHPIVRSGLRAVFADDPGFQVVGEADRAAASVALATELQPDLVTMDLRFPEGMSGVEAIIELRALQQPPAILVLTNYADDSDISRAIAAGAQGYLLKDAAPAELLRAARAAANGSSVIAPLVAEKLVQRMRDPQPDLTQRELDVLRALAGGASNKQISEQLFIGATTVKTHLARIYAKLGVSSRTAALVRARELGLVD